MEPIASTSTGQPYIRAREQNAPDVNVPPTPIAQCVKDSLPLLTNLEKYLDKEFSHVIVYLDDDAMSLLRNKRVLGQFCIYEAEYLSPGTGLTDWDVAQNQHLNRVRTPVKTLCVRFNGTEYCEAALFCRIRGTANPLAVRKIVFRLNKQLNVYKDHVRNGIAEEWCAQEQWRIYPRFLKDCLKPLEFGSHGKVTLYDIPEFDIPRIMKELLPEGYDDEWPM